MSLRVRLEFDGIDAYIEQGLDRGMFILANQIQADSNNYVPELSGDLKRYSQVSNDNKSITWNQPYARFQYYGNFKNYTKPGTGPKWYEVAKSKHLASWLNITKDGFK